MDISAVIFIFVSFGSIIVAFVLEGGTLGALVSYFKNISYKTRKNGLLSLEGEITEDESLDPFIKKGLQLVVDGVDPQAVRSILELELNSISDRHRQCSTIFDSAGGYAPTMGIVGTVMGLVHV